MSSVLKNLYIALVFSCVAAVSSAQTKTPVLTTPLMGLGRDEVARDRFQTLKVVADTVATETKQLEEDVKQRRQELEEIMLCGQYGMLRAPADGELKSWKSSMQVAGTQITQAMCAPALVERIDAVDAFEELPDVGYMQMQFTNHITDLVVSADMVMACSTYTNTFEIWKIIDGVWQPLKNTSNQQNIAPGGDIDSCAFDNGVAVFSLRDNHGFAYAEVVNNVVNVGTVSGAYVGAMVENIQFKNNYVVLLQNLHSGSSLADLLSVYKYNGSGSFQLLFTEVTGAGFERDIHLSKNGLFSIQHSANPVFVPIAQIETATHLSNVDNKPVNITGATCASYVNYTVTEDGQYFFCSGGYVGSLQERIYVFKFNSASNSYALSQSLTVTHAQPRINQSVNPTCFADRMDSGSGNIFYRVSSSTEFFCWAGTYNSSTGINSTAAKVISYKNGSWVVENVPWSTTSGETWMHSAYNQVNVSNGFMFTTPNLSALSSKYYRIYYRRLK